MLVLRISILFFIISGILNPLFARQGKNTAVNGKETHDISGIMQDSLGKPVIGATVKIRYGKDSLVTHTDEDGVFYFENFGSATFTITVSGIGFSDVVRRYLNNYLKKTIVLDPIVLKQSVMELAEVKVNGTPSIKYKVDTVEYRAGDYTVPPAARLDELLKKMEGMEVGKDGTLVYQGQEVSQAKLNGKAFAGGEVKQAIQTLPASIVEKIQIIDDYGDFAAKTGIKDGAAKKTLNITTKPERSIGTFSYIKAQAGNNDRYANELTLDNLNANRVIHIGGDLSKTVNGIASADPISSSLNGDQFRPASQGNTAMATPAISYANEWNGALSLVASYSYNYLSNDAVVKSYGDNFYSRGLSSFSSENVNDNLLRAHEFKFQMDINPSKANFFQFTVAFIHHSAERQDSALTNALNDFNTGFEYQRSQLNNFLANPSTDYNFSTNYLHLFSKPKRIFSSQFSYSHERNRSDLEAKTRYSYYQDASFLNLVNDSLTNLLTVKSDRLNLYKANLVYTEPLSEFGRLELGAVLKLSNHINSAMSETQGNIPGGNALPYTNDFRFNFTDAKLSLVYRYGNNKSDLSLGVALMPSLLSTLEGQKNHNAQFRIVPVIKYSRSWSMVERFQFSYTAYNSEPNAQQLQPFTDRSDPNNLVLGNPMLKTAFTHFFNTNYSRYFPNQKINVSGGIDFRLYKDRVVADLGQFTSELANGITKTTTLTSFANKNGSYQAIGRYGLSKQLNNRAFALSFNGNVVINSMIALSNGSDYRVSTKQFNERFSARIAINNSFELNPYLGHRLISSGYSLADVAPDHTSIAQLALDGKLSFAKNFLCSFEINKNFVKGLSGNVSNPLIINAGIEKSFFKQRSLTLTFNCFDLLQQNNLIQQVITPQSNISTLSNPFSRYFLLGLRLNLQKWSGTPQRNGEPMKRRGDGSFIN